MSCLGDVESKHEVIAGERFIALVRRFCFCVVGLLRRLYVGLAWTLWHVEHPLCRGRVVVRPVLDVGRFVVLCFRIFVEGDPLVILDSFIVVRRWFEIFRGVWWKGLGGCHRRC